MLKKLAGIYESRIRPHAKKILVGILIFLFVFTVTGFFVLPPIVKSVLTKQLSANLHREVTIGQVRINPYTFSVTVRGLAVKERSSAATFVSCKELYVNLEGTSLLRLALILKEIRLTEPYINVVRKDDLSYNFSDLLEADKPAAPAKKEKSKPLRFSLNNIRIENGSVDFMDGPNKTKHTIRELTIGVPFLSNIRSYVERFVQPHFSARIDGALYTIQGKTKPFANSLETFVDVSVKDLNVPYYLAYVPMKMKFEIASALVDTQTRVSFIETKNKKTQLTVQGSLALKNLVVNDAKKKPFFKLPLLDVGIAPSEPLSQIIHLSKVSIQSPDVEVTRDAKGVLNVEALLPEEKKEKAGAKKTAKAEKTGKTGEASNQALSLDIDAITLSGGRIAFSDLSAEKPFKTVLSPVELKVDHFSNGRDRQAIYALSIESEAKETVKAQGRFSLDPLGSEGMIEVSSVVLKKYGPLCRKIVLFDIEDGRLDLSTLYKYAQGQKEPEIDLSGLSLSLRSLRLGKPGDKTDFFKLPTLAVSHTELDLAKKTLRVGSFSTRGGEIMVERLQNGDLSLLKLFPSTPAAEGQGKTAAAETSKKTAAPAAAPKAPAGKTAAQAKAAEPEKPWLVLLKQVLVDKYTVRVEDHATPTPAVLIAQNLRIKGDNISTAKNAKGKIAVSCLLNGKGKVSAAGTVGIEPIFADLKIAVAGVEAAPFQPYLADKVTMTVTGGSLSTAGALSLVSDKEGRVKAAYKGDASVVNFSSIDKSHGQDLLKLESLSLSGMAVNTEPFSVDIKGISLANFYALVSISPEGKVNLQEMLAAKGADAEAQPRPAPQETGAPVQPAPAAPAASAPPSPAKAAPPQPSPPQPRTPGQPSSGREKAAAPAGKEAPPKAIKIDQITLKGGRIDFSDASVKPRFAAHISEMAGKVTGLSAEQNTAAAVDLRAKLDDYAPLEITGKINPLRDDLYVDLKIRLKDLDLSPATPYAGTYAGYTIAKGKLSLDLSYSIAKRKLDAQNNIFIDQFTFGEKVESPKATKLPVRFAVSLLKDRKGEINLEIPVSGSLDDPKFSVGRIILRVIVNLIAKAATSPFALLGAAFGGGEELSYAEFDYGSEAIPDPGMKKLASVAKALRDRPSLKLDIEGHVDMQRDREGLRQVIFTRKIKAQKLNAITKKGQPAVPVDDVRIEPAEYAGYLKAAYKEEKFPKPKNFIGLAKDIPVPEMEKLMLAHTEVTDGDLRALASQRAMRVKDAILKSGQVEPERVFIVEPKSLAPEKKEKVKDSRVDFKLK
jgi:uncharacterized protein involved in outer membrane biogenesis